MLFAPGICMPASMKPVHNVPHGWVRQLRGSTAPLRPVVGELAQMAGIIVNDHGEAWEALLQLVDEHIPLGMSLCPQELRESHNGT